MKGEFKRMILESIVDIAMSPVDIFKTMVEAGYGASGRKLERKLYEVQSRRWNFIGEIRNKRKNFNNMIYKLKRDGLIIERRDGLMATSLGKSKLKKIAESFLHRSYKVKRSEDLVIVMFDVPETQRHKRRWLREVLRGMGFEMRQKSVWLGRIDLPKRFISDLETLGLIDHIDIFRATKMGSLD